MNDLAGLFCVIALAYLLIEHGCGRGPRITGVSWFDIAPHLRESKKHNGRAQQTKAHRKAKTRR